MTDEAGIGVGPSERQVNTLSFQQLCHFKIFDEEPENLSPKERYQLIAISNRYGFTFVGTNTALIKIIKTDDLAKISEELQETPGCTVEEYPHQSLPLEGRPFHIALNCDEQVLSVVLRGDTGLKVQLFDVVAVSKQASSVKPFIVTSLSKEPNVDLIDLQWNPTNGSIFAVCLSDGGMVLWNWSEGRIGQLSVLPTAIKANAICWSPKGKQIVVGTADGELVQFTHKMEQKKVVTKPDFTNEPVKVVDILWPSTFMWVAAYIDEDESIQPNLTIVNAPKDQPSSYINFEDICYGSGEDRKAKYYMKFLDKWGFIIASSGNSMETGILGQDPGDNAKWDIWTLDDSARIELPLHESGDDTFPMGFGVDFSSERPFTAKNKEKCPAVPIVMLLSSEGLLCPFHVVNSEAKEPLQQKTEPLPAEGVSKGIEAKEPLQQKTEPLPAEGVSKETGGQTSTDGQPAGMGQPNQGSIQLTTTSVAPSVTKPPVQQQTASPVTNASQKPFGTTARTLPFGGTPFSFSNPVTSLSTQSPSFSFVKPQGVAGMPAPNSTGAAPQGLFGPTLAGQAPGASPFSFSKPQDTVFQPSAQAATSGAQTSSPAFFSFSKPQGVLSQPSDSPTSSGAQTSAPAAVSFTKPQGASAQLAASTASLGAQSTVPPSFSFSKPQGVLSQPSDATSSGAQSPAPLSFSFTKPQGASAQLAASTASSGAQSTAPPLFSFAKTQGALSQPSDSTTSSGAQSPAPVAFSFTKPQGASTQLAASTGSSGAQSTVPAPFSFTKPKGTASPFGQVASGASPFGQAASGGPFSFNKPQGNVTVPATSSLSKTGTESQKPPSSSIGLGQTQGAAAHPSQTTGVPSALGTLLGGKVIPTSEQAPKIPPQRTTQQASAPPNQVAPLMKTLPFKVTEEPQGQSSQITIPKVQDAPKTPGNLSVTIPIEHQKGAMQALAQRASEGGAAARVPYRPVVEPVSPVSTISTQGGEGHLESALMSNILDEMDHFEKEVGDLKARTRDGRYAVGNRQELQAIRKTMDDLVAFQTDVLDCTKSLNEDIHSIKTKLLNSFALLEESKIRKQRNRDPKFITLLKARGLDPQTESKMQSMKGMVHYLDVGTRDVNRSLDMEWEEHQRRGDRNGSRKLTTPTMDTIYHTLRNHHNVMASQRVALEDIREKLVRAQKYDPVGALYKGPLPSPKFSSDHVEPLALQLSQTKLSPSRRQRPTPASSKKQALLRDILSRRTQTPVRSSPKVLMREEQVSSPRLSISSQESIPRTSSHPRKLDFTDNSGTDVDAAVESKLRQEIPRGRSTPLREVSQQRTNLSERELPPAFSHQSMMKPHPQMVPTVPPTIPQTVFPTAATSVSRPAPPTTTTIVTTKSSPQKDTVTTTTPSSFAHTGTGTVLWGADAAKASPSQLAGAAAISRMASKGPGAAGEPTQQPKLPPNVNIKNLDSLKSTMPPPVTFAAVASSIDTGTAQVVTQVLSEITATSGKSIPPPGTAVTDNSRRSSKSVDDPAMLSSVGVPESTPGIVTTVSDTKTSTVAEAPQSGGALHTPVAASTPVEPQTETQPVKFDFTVKNNNASTSVPGGFFMSAKPEVKAGTSSEGLPKAEKKAGASNAGSGENLTLKGLLMGEPEDTSTAATAPAAASVTSTSQSAAVPPSGPLKFTLSKPTKSQVGGLPSSFSFGPSSTTTFTPTSSSAFSQPQPLFSQATSAKTEVTTAATSRAAVTKSTDSGGSSASGASTESKITGETEAAGNLVFSVTKTGVNASSVTAKGVDEAGTRTGQIGTPPTTGSGQSIPSSSAMASTTQSITSTSVTASSPFALLSGGTVVKPQGGTSFSFAPAASTAASFGASGSAGASTVSKGFSFTPTAATSVTAVTSTAATSATIVSSTVASTSGSIFSSGGTATVVSSSFSTAPSATPSGFSFTVPSSTSGFGTSSSLFGGSATAKPSLFSQPAGSSGFGQAGTGTASTTSSGFSFSQPSSGSQSVFGQSTSTTQSIFGQPTTSTQSPFGQPALTSQSVFGQPSTFGSQTTSLFGQQSGFGQTPASSAPSSGLFGQAAPSLGGSQSSSGLFGQTASASSPAASLSSGGGGFGGLFGLGGKPNPEAAKVNPFGVSASSAGTGPFGTGGNNLFGSAGPKAFGSPTNSNQSSFGSGPFSSGSSGVGTGGFGGFSQQSTAPQVGFGGAPSFGGSPGAFGSKPAFGGSPGFGSGAAFSNPLGQSPFGASSPSGPVFGASASSTMGNTSGGFGGFASQNTPSFGGLASSSPQASGFASGGGFGSVPSGGGFGASGGFGAGFGGSSSSNTSFGSGSFSQYRK